MNYDYQVKVNSVYQQYCGMLEDGFETISEAKCAILEQIEDLGLLIRNSETCNAYGVAEQLILQSKRIDGDLNHMEYEVTRVTGEWVATFEMFES